MSAETVKQFYRKWYDLHNMAVIAVGDFSDTQVCFVSIQVSVLRSHENVSM